MSKKSLTIDTPHVWVAKTDEILGPEKIAYFLEVLSDDERARYNRFRFNRDRQIFLVAHCLLRSALSHYSKHSPQSWLFQANDYGRPELDQSMSATGLRFNLSHTHGLAACIVTGTVDCGIDVEYFQRKNNLLAIARKMFSDKENQHLRSLSGGKQEKAFLTYWTLKEAYAKACGIGLSMPVQEIEFDIENLQNIRVKFINSLDDNASNWCFTVGAPTSEHILATAIKNVNQKYTHQQNNGYKSSCMSMKDLEASLRF